MEMTVVAAAPAPLNKTNAIEQGSLKRLQQRQKFVHSTLTALTLQLLKYNLTIDMAEFCSCVYLPSGRTCRECFVARFQFYITRRLMVLQEKHFAKHPEAAVRYVTTMLREIRDKLHDRMWEAYCDEGEEDLAYSWIAAVIAETYAEIMERRQQLISKYIMGPVERVITQHFRPLVGKDVALPFRKRCLRCSRRPRKNTRYGSYSSDSEEEDSEEDEDQQRGDYDSDQFEIADWKVAAWGKLPPSNLRAYLIEESLYSIDKEDVPETVRGQRAYERSNFAIHQWSNDRSLLL